MTPSERTVGHDPSEQPPAASPPTEIGVTPFPDEVIVFQEQPDGNHTISFPGKVSIQGVVTEGQITIAIRPPVAFKPAESHVTAQEEQSSGLIPESTSPPVREPHSAADKRSWEKLLTEVGEEMPEDENQLFNLKGNPAKKLRYRVTKTTNTRIHDFVLATHPDPNNKKFTENWRIRAFHDDAEKVRDQMEVGQTGVEVTVYGPKYWKGSKKTKDGRKDTVVKGYIAGFIKIPKEEQGSGASQTQQKD